MACYSATEMQQKLNEKPYIQEKLYINGFLITDQNIEISDGYPFYGNWSMEQAGCFQIYTHKNAVLTTHRENETVYFMVGHAVDPFDHLSDETAILTKLSAAYREGIDSYFKAQNDLTGVYCTGFIHGNELYLTNDCAGMQIVYYGTIDGRHYFTSHIKFTISTKISRIKIKSAF